MKGNNRFNRIKTEARAHTVEFTRQEMLVLEMMQFQLGSSALAEILGLAKGKVEKMEKSIYRKTGCLDLQELLLYFEVYKMEFKK
ncbi:helix-turn-helix transcriptional regulator [Maribacter algicola]|uniref:Helix-turn-helix transcriptional regulator n=1 Tax=Meishania litoralis TaxID=3434685 RepID=A0ACC7LI11_9FLAO